MRTGAAVACELSGGLDSTSVAATALRLVRAGEVPADRVVALSCLFPDSPRADERSHIDPAVRELGIDWVGVRTEAQRAAWLDDDAAFAADIPAPPDGPDHRLLAATARELGAGVVLTGHFGDDWLDASHLALPDLLRSARITTAWGRARSGEAGVAEALQTLATEGARPLAPRWLRRPGQVRAPWVTGSPRVAAGLDERRRPGSGGPRRFSGFSARQDWAAVTGGVTAQIREYLDRDGAIAGVEGRHPFCDRRLVEFCARTPSWVVSSPSDPRWLHRTALQATLPPSTRTRRSKGTFGQVWLREVERQLAAVPLGATAVVDRTWVRADVVARRLEHARHMLSGPSGAGGIRGIWAVLATDAAIRAIEAGAPVTGAAPPIEALPTHHMETAS